MTEISLKNKQFFQHLIYAIFATVLFPYLWTFSDNPDTYQYLIIARNFSDGIISINSYWSPLISWLLIVPIKLFGHDLIVFKTLQLVIGWFALFQFQKLVMKFEIREKNLLVWGIIPFILSHAFLNLTPDLLFLTLTLTLINLFLSPNKKVFPIALTGALLYYCKSFGFLFFLALSSMWFLWMEKNTKLFQKIIIWFAVFTLPWICILSVQYKKITWGEAAAFNRSIDVAPLPERGDELPILKGGLFKPLEGSSSAWEDPGAFVSSNQIRLYSSPAKFVHVVWRNFQTIWYYDFSRQPGIIFLLLLIIVFFKRKIFKSKAFYLLVALIFVNYFAYSMILIHPRYVWINSWLMLVVSAFIADKIILNKNLYQVFLLLLILWFVKRPVKELLFTEDKDLPFAWIFKGVKYPDQTLNIMYDDDHKLEKISEEIKNLKPIGAFAAIKSNKFGRNTYTAGLRIAYDSRNVFFGQINSGQFQKTDLLKGMNIRYLLSFNRNDTLSAPVIFRNTDSTVTLYQLY